MFVMKLISLAVILLSPPFREDNTIVYYFQTRKVQSQVNSLPWRIHSALPHPPLFLPSLPVGLGFLRGSIEHQTLTFSL